MKIFCFSPLSVSCILHETPSKPKQDMPIDSILDTLQWYFKNFLKNYCLLEKKTSLLFSFFWKVYFYLIPAISKFQYILYLLRFSAITTLANRKAIVDLPKNLKLQKKEKSLLHYVIILYFYNKMTFYNKTFNSIVLNSASSFQQKSSLICMNFLRNETLNCKFFWYFNI